MADRRPSEGTVRAGWEAAVLTVLVERELLRAVAVWRDGGLYVNLVARAGAATDGPLDAAAVRDVAVAGTPSACADAVTARAQAGASSIVLAPLGGDPLDQLERFADGVLPRLESVSRD